MSALDANDFHFPRLLDLLDRADTESIAQVAADEVVFSSPVANYCGHGDVVHLLGLVAQVLQSPVPTESTESELRRLTSFTAGIRGDCCEVEGFLREQYDEAGNLLHATLFLRPLASMRCAIAQMKELLSQSPLPSSLESAE